MFINGSHLINVPLSVVAWEYTGHFGHHQPQWHGGSFWHRTAVAGNDVITQLKLPHAAALASVKGFNDSMYVLKPGTQVALVVNENGPERDEIIRGVTENLKKVGVDVVASANMAFICETEMGKSKTVPYRLFGRGEQSVTVTEKTHRIRLRSR